MSQFFLQYACFYAQTFMRMKSHSSLDRASTDTRCVASPRFLQRQAKPVMRQGAKRSRATPHAGSECSKLPHAHCVLPQRFRSIVCVLVWGRCLTKVRFPGSQHWAVRCLELPCATPQGRNGRSAELERCVYSGRRNNIRT